MENAEHVEKLNKFIEDYLRSEDEFSPVSATALGIHKHDAELEDFSESNLRRIKSVLREDEKKFSEINYDALDRESKIKYHLMLERINSAWRFLEKTRQFETDPAFYVALSVNSIFLLLLRNFAPLEDRLISASSRMEKFPELFNQARANVKNPPPVFTSIAFEMVEGAFSIIDSLIPEMLKQAPSVKDRVNKARDIARKAYTDFKHFIVEDLKERSHGDYAIGRELMDEMLKGADFLDFGSDELWEIGQVELEKCENEITEFVKENYDKTRPWREVFHDLKKNHPPAGELVATYVKFLEEARCFVIEKDLVTIPDNQRLIAVETPEFNRKLTPTAAMMPPAPYEEDHTSFLWVTPVDLTQSPEEQEKQLRDHTYGKIRYVSLHEAYPGHHLQLVYSSRIQDPLYKRTFSNIFIEGWAFYCEQLMKEFGYFDKDSEFCQLESAYWRALRILLDIGLHTKRFTFDEAYEFLHSKVIRSPFVAMAEIKRYTETPTQALSYYIGKLEIFRIRDAYRKTVGSSFNLKKFHDELLSYGSLPPKVIEWKMGIREIDLPALAMH